MKNAVISLLLVLGTCCACQSPSSTNDLTEDAAWRLGWRMIADAQREDFATAELRFDSLLAATENLERPFLTVGLEAKLKQGKPEEADALLARQAEPMRVRICPRPAFHGLAACAGYTEERVSNEELRRELLEMYVRDQAVRGNVKDDIITEYTVDTTGLYALPGMAATDRSNRERLQAIFTETGFPDRDQVGRDALFGVFMMIQHAEGDPEWQRAQLPKIEAAVRRGDLDGQSYAYLYDRIQVNAGRPQRYGTQFAKVDPVTRTVELQPVEDPDRLDERRREMGMMPIGMYKAMVFETL